MARGRLLESMRLHQVKELKKKLITVCESSIGSSISAVFKNTFPLQSLHSISSKLGNLSRLIIPVTNLDKNKIKFWFKSDFKLKEMKKAAENFKAKKN
jgi:hypothetical protein